jgi:hypothetical protein
MATSDSAEGAVMMIVPAALHASVESMEIPKNVTLVFNTEEEKLAHGT